MAWGYSASGYLWCDTCSGAEVVACPNSENHWWDSLDARGPGFADCELCDVSAEPSLPHVSCPECVNGDGSTYAGP